MENQILDKPIQDSFSDFLDKGETILWKGQAEIKKSLYEFDLGDGGIIFYLIFYKIISPLILKIIYVGKNKHTQYAITSKRILFSLGHWKKNRIQDIPFSKLKNLLITQDEKKKVGTIFLAMKNPTTVNFETYEIINHKKSEKRHQPTLENLKQVNKVAKFIRQGIKDANN